MRECVCEKERQCVCERETVCVCVCVCVREKERAQPTLRRAGSPRHARVPQARAEPGPGSNRSGELPPGARPYGRSAGSTAGPRPGPGPVADRQEGAHGWPMLRAAPCLSGAGKDRDGSGLDRGGRVTPVGETCLSEGGAVSAFAHTLNLKP